MSEFFNGFATGFAMQAVLFSALSIALEFYDERVTGQRWQIFT